MRKDQWDPSKELTLDVLLSEDSRTQMRNVYANVTSEEIHAYLGATNLGRIIEKLKARKSIYVQRASSVTDYREQIDVLGDIISVLEDEAVESIKESRAKLLADRIHQNFLNRLLDETMMEALHGDAGDRD